MPYIRHQTTKIFLNTDIDQTSGIHVNLQNKWWYDIINFRTKKLIKRMNCTNQKIL